MTFLPIVERELHVAARRRITYWTRSGAALLATALAVWIFETSAAVAGASAGGHLFGILSTSAWVACLAAGVFLTADSLSEEKRSGTLGLLFLTDLRPADIVLGKLAASSLTGFYGLLAIFPVLAMPLILGGVSWWEFARVAVGLSGTLLFSLCLGMFCSACFRSERPTMATTAGALAVWAIPTVLVPGLRVISPLTLHLLALGKPGFTSVSEYIFSLLAVAGCGGALLWCASWVLPGAWQDQPVRAPARWDWHWHWHWRWRGRWGWRGFGSKPKGETGESLPAAGSVKPPRSLADSATLEVNPAQWLFSRHSSGSLIWLVTILGASVLFLTWFNPSPAWWLQLFLICSIHGALKLCMAWEASRILEDHHRAGGLELVLVSRMTVVDILNGCVGTLRFMFKRAITLVICLDAISAVILVAKSLRGAGPLGRHDVLTGTLFTGLILLGMLLMDLWALSWLGMWLGLRHHRPWRAALECALRLFILPWVLPIAALVLSGGSSTGVTGLPVALFLAWIGCSFLVAYGLGSGAKKKLHDQFRQKVASVS
ncbi:MAG TPA: hypothetical protein VNU68_22545 [Verrucomicrobiae bacterium]|nr:hypothetical protein [Verrucomicrobiae bacterium]